MIYGFILVWIKKNNQLSDKSVYLRDVPEYKQEEFKIGHAGNVLQFFLQIL